MPAGTNCPLCRRDIGVLSVFLAGTPNKIRCPHCKTRLRYIGVRRLLWTLALVATLVFGSSFALVEYVFQIEDEDKRCLIFAGLFFTLWEVVELSVTIYLQRNKTLECIPNA